MLRGQRFVVTWAFNVAALWVAAALLHGVYVTGANAWLTYVLAGLVFSLVNMVVKPIVAILAIPLIVLTLGARLLPRQRADGLPDELDRRQLPRRRLLERRRARP